MRVPATMRGPAGKVAAGLVGMVTLGGCNGGHSTDPGSPPRITNLQVLSVSRAAPGESPGVLGLSLEFSDDDSDVQFLFFVDSGGGVVSSDLREAYGRQSGSVSVFQTIALPAKGTAVPFGVMVGDRVGNRSNELRGSFIAP